MRNASTRAVAARNSATDTPALRFNSPVPNNSRATSLMLRPALLIPRRTANNSITIPRIDAASSTRSSVPVNPTTANHAGTLNQAAAADADTTANSSSVNRTVTLFGRPPSTRVRREPRTTQEDTP